MSTNALDHFQKIDRSQNIDGWRVRMYFLSRHPSVLLGVALAILALAAGIAWLVQKPAADRKEKHHRGVEEFRQELTKPKPDIATIIRLLPRAAYVAHESATGEQWIANSQLSQTEKLVVTAAWKSSSGRNQLEPSADLLYYAHYVKPLRFANELLGDFYAADEQFDKAISYYRRELRFPDPKSARQKLLALAMERRDRVLLRELTESPDFASVIKPEHRVFAASIDHRWLDLVMPMAELQRDWLKPIPLALAAVGGLMWFIIALQSIQIPALASFRTFLPIVALLLGMLSTFPTIISGEWMEQTFGLRDGESLRGEFLYYLLSVGPREELIKLALFAPMLVVLLFRDCRLEALVCAGCVGLGFAIWENLLYFSHYGPLTAFPRFLTANFFHAALTGLNGLALYELLRSPVKKFLPFVGTLLATIAAHGLYDFFATLGIQVGSIVALVLVSLFYFRKLRGLRDGTTDQLSIAATFIVGISLLGGLILVVAAHSMGLELAAEVLGITAGGMVMVGYMFYWQLGAAMSEVEEPAPASYRL